MPNITIQRRNGDVYNVQVDRGDLERCLEHTWLVALRGVTNQPWVYTRVKVDRKWRNVPIHRFILGDVGAVRHRDGNGLNNHRSNLVVAARTGEVRVEGVRTGRKEFTLYSGKRPTHPRALVEGSRVRCSECGLDQTYGSGEQAGRVASRHNARYWG